MNTIPDVPASSLRADGSRNYVHPADVKGRFTRRRRITFAILIAILVGLPFVRIGGHPAMQLDVKHRLFFLFGRSFNAQDFWLTFFILTGIGFALIVLTTLWGRVWCGYACPQTVFLEGIYRPIERLLEGPRNERLRRNAGPRSFDRAWRKTIKHLLYIALSLFLSHVFLTYFVSLPAMWTMISEGPAAHPEAFAWVMGGALILYFDFAWFREQLCLIICPYGRLQSAMTDSDTLVIGYDVERGEPRGKASDPHAGDCVNCHRCVVVCPTGIDIRNGLQIECIGCAACVDACDEVMTRLKRPTGLVRYDSLNGFHGEPKRFLRPRVYLYGLLGVVGLAVASFAFAHHEPFEANVLRASNTPFTVTDGRVLNSLRIHLVNKQSEPRTFRIEGLGDDLDYVLPMPEVHLQGLASTYVPIMVRLPIGKIQREHKIRLRVTPVEQPNASEVLILPFVTPSSGAR